MENILPDLRNKLGPISNYFQMKKGIAKLKAQEVKTEREDDDRNEKVYQLEKLLGEETERAENAMAYILELIREK